MRAMLIAIAFAFVPVAATAHHGWSSYNSGQPLKLTAPLSAVTWSNPHGTARVSYNGKVWAVVLAPTARMEARGLTQDAIKKTKAVTLEGFPRSDGTPEMRIERVTIDDRTVELR